jgi:uncharacterized membrane protein
VERHGQFSAHLSQEPVRLAGSKQGRSIMENGNVGWQRGESPGRGGSSSGDADTGQDLRWIPVALGAAAIVAKLGGRNKGAAALALSAGAVAAAVGAARGKQQGGGAAGKSEVERSITIGKTADELRRIWLDPRTLPQIIAGFATVRALGDGRLHWKVEGPHGRAWEWETETVDRAGEGIGWHSLSGGAMSNDGMLRFQGAPAGRGTVVTLRVRFEPPGGALGGGVLSLLGNRPLRFKNLVETGEIPTTVRQPAARADTR